MFGKVIRCPFEWINSSMDDQISIFTCPFFNLTFRHGLSHAFLWTTKFQSEQVNPKSYLPSLATKVWFCLQHCNGDQHFWKIKAYEFNVIKKLINMPLNTTEDLINIGRQQSRGTIYYYSSSVCLCYNNFNRVWWRLWWDTVQGFFAI